MYLKNKLIFILVFLISLNIFLATTPKSHAIANPVGILDGSKYPWVVKLDIVKDSSAASCTGSLINRYWVLTAAHCLKGAKDIYISYGGSTSYSGTFNLAQSFYINPGYNLIKNTGDIALIRMQNPYEGYTTNLPEINNYISNKAIYYALGYGVNEFANLDGALRFSTAELYDKKRLLNSNLAKLDNSLIPLSFLNGRSYQGVCEGDSGGPLVLSGEKSILVAIHTATVSEKKGDGCLASKLSIETNVYYYLDWIKSIVNKNTTLTYKLSDYKPPLPKLSRSLGRQDISYLDSYNGVSRTLLCFEGYYPTKSTINGKTLSYIARNLYNHMHKCRYYITSQEGKSMLSDEFIFLEYGLNEFRSESYFYQQSTYYVDGEEYILEFANKDASIKFYPFMNKGSVLTFAYSAKDNNIRNSPDCVSVEKDSGSGYNKLHIPKSCINLTDYPYGEFISEGKIDSFSSLG